MSHPVKYKHVYFPEALPHMSAAFPFDPSHHAQIDLADAVV